MAARKFGLTVLRAKNKAPRNWGPFCQVKTTSVIAQAWPAWGKSMFSTRPGKAERRAARGSAAFGGDSVSLSCA